MNYTSIASLQPQIFITHLDSKSIPLVFPAFYILHDKLTWSYTSVFCRSMQLLMSSVWILNSLTCIDHDYCYIMVSMQFDVLYMYHL